MAREVKLTKAGYERLMQQLERERERLQEATKILQELMESSDDYDDSGPEAAKQEKARIEARIDSLEDILSRAVILEEEAGRSSAWARWWSWKTPFPGSGFPSRWSPRRRPTSWTRP